MIIDGLFQTPIYSAMVEEAGVLEKFLDVHKQITDEGKFRLREDWQSLKLSDPTFKENLIEKYNCNEFMNALTKHVFTYINAINFGNQNTRFKLMSSWMTSYTKKEYAHIHSHADADISGVYYVKSSGEDGNIFFQNPNKLMTASHVYNQLYDRVTYKPEPGRIILFPGWLEHGVLTNTTDNERVSVSFNITFDRHF
jgi:hypothetical protein